MTKILAIDDNLDNLIVIKALLSDSFPDALIFTVQSGIEGLNVAQKENPDVILLDLVMPVMDGFETCKRIKEDENLKRIPVIILTALRTDAQSRIKTLQLGAEAFLSKPIDEAELVAQVNTMIRIKKSEETIRDENQRLEKLVHERTQKLQEELEERKKTEAKNEELRFLLQSGLESPQNMILILIDPTYHYINLNSVHKNSMKTSYGIDVKIGMNILDCITNDDDRMRAKNNYDLALAGISHLTIEEFGELERYYFENRYNPILNDRNEVIGATSFSIDITERKRTEDELRKLWRAVEQSPASIIITDTNGDIEFCNSKASETTGYTKEELIGTNPRIFQSGETSAETYEEIWDHITAGNEWRGELHNKKKNGVLYWESISMTPIMNAKGQIMNFLAVKEDITKQKEYIAELKEAKHKAEENDRLKSAFLANISHEIRTPMNGILGFADLLKAPKLSSEEQSTFIHVIEQSGKRMLNIINDIVDIAKIESGQVNINIQEVNLNQLMKDLQTFFGPEIEGKGIAFTYTIELPDQSSTLNTDLIKLTQILTNLLKNAIKFTKTGAIIYGYTIKDKKVEFYVKDSGAGIAPDQKEIIFERFTQGSILLTRNYEGAGLGLSISKAYVEMLGGEIWLESELEQGATFFFTIPYHENATEQIEAPENSNETNNRTPMTILIAEDDENSMNFLCEILKNQHTKILLANNGKEAIDIVKSDSNIDIILMDLKMPIMDGFEATRQIKLLNPLLPIIAQTAYAFADDAIKAKQAGCDEYISKPINRKLLISKINQLIIKEQPI